MSTNTKTNTKINKIKINIDPYYYHQKNNIIITIMFLMGALMGYICWIIGSVILIQSIRSAIRYIKYHHQWISTINNIGSSTTRSKTYKGHIVEATKLIHPITKDISYKIIYQYDFTNNNNSNDTSSNTSIKKIITSYQDSKWIYENHHHQAVLLLNNKKLQKQPPPPPSSSDNDGNNSNSRFFDVKVLIDEPNSGIPSDILYYKLTTSKFWSTIVDPTIAFGGIHLYAFGCITYAWIATLESIEEDDSMFYWILLTLSLVFAPLLMLPFLLKEQALRHKQRMDIIQTDPSLFESELEYIQRLFFDKLGCTTTTKTIHVMLFVIGIIELFWVTGMVVGCVGFISVWCWTLLITDGIQTKREHLERYKNHMKSQTIEGKIVDHHRMSGGGRYAVTIQYDMTCKEKKEEGGEEEEEVDEEKQREVGEGNNARSSSATVVTVEKQYQVSKQLYRTFITTTTTTTNENSHHNNNDNYDKPTTIPIRVLNGYPCSGIPVDKLVYDIVNSWTTPLLLHCLFWFTFLIYFAGCFFMVIDYEFDLYWDYADLIYYAISFLIGPVMMIPQLSTFHCIQYQKLVDSTVFNGNIIHKRKKMDDEGGK